MNTNIDTKNTQKTWTTCTNIFCMPSPEEQNIYSYEDIFGSLADEMLPSIPTDAGDAGIDPEDFEKAYLWFLS